jgi:hypothetical protein
MLMPRRPPATALIGATATRAELKAPGVCPLPCGRAIERVLRRNGLTAPRVRLAPLLRRLEYPARKPGLQPLHQVDLVGPVYFKSRRHRHSIGVRKDAFDGAVCLRLAG